MSNALVEFLLARYAERAQVADEWPNVLEPRPPDGWPFWVDTRGHPIYEPRTAVLADVDSKRRIIEHVDLYGEDDAILRLLGLPHVGHPDYRPEWRP